MTMDINAVSMQLKAVASAEYFACGSRVVCNPAPTDTDEDWLVILSGFSAIGKVEKFLVNKGWTVDNDDDYKRNGFTSLRAGTLNLILMQAGEAVDRFKLATNVCKELNVTDRAARIRIHEAIQKWDHGKKPGAGQGFPWGG